MTVKERIRNLVEETKVGEALDVLLDWADQHDDNDLQNTGILLKSRWNQLQKQQMMGLLEYSQSLRQQAVISHSLLEVSEQIKDDALSDKLPDEGEDGSGPSSFKRDVILFLASNPSKSAKLQLDKEFIEIFNALQDGEIEFTLKAEWAITPNDLQRAILKHRPRIIHFSGHGAGTGNSKQEGTRELDFEDEEPHEGGIYVQTSIGKPKLVAARALTNLFRVFSKKIEIDVVLLNACHSQPQAEAISEHVPYVIGMNKAVSDRSAIDFSIGFYQGISNEDDIEFAFNLAANNIMLEGGFDEAETPVLYQQ